MEKLSSANEKITITGPITEIESLVIQLKKQTSCVHVIRSSPHFPHWDSIKDLFLIVPREDLEELIRKVCSTLESSSIYRGWIDFSQIIYPICCSTPHIVTCGG